ncbi:MAG: TraR/DksA family transcriptional regulator [Rhizobiaceae bacterium]
MANEQLAHDRLAKRKRELEALSDLSAEARDPVALDQQSVGRLSRMDAMQQQAMNQATEQKRKFDLVRIEAAKRRLRDGEYGYCEDCGEEIPDGRLEIDPMAEFCVNCAS